MSRTPSRIDSLQSIPVPRPEISMHQTADGLIQLRYPVRLTAWLARLFPTSKPMRTLELDVMGSYVWSLLDGKRSVDEMAATLASAYALHPAEAQQAVALFLRRLGQRGIVELRAQSSMR